MEITQWQRFFSLFLQNYIVLNYNYWYSKLINCIDKKLYKYMYILYWIMCFVLNEFQQVLFECVLLFCSLMQNSLNISSFAVLFENLLEKSSNLCSIGTIWVKSRACWRYCKEHSLDMSFW